MKRALVLAICLLLVGVGMSQAQKERVSPTTPGQHWVDPTRAYFEGFEGTFPPAGWTLVSSNAYTWYQSIYSAYEGAYGAQCDYDEMYTGPQDEFLKFNQAVTAADNHLNFAMMGSYYWSTAPYANYDMFVTINGTQVWSWVAMRNPAGANWVWEIFDVDLSAYIGQTIEIGFEYAGYDGAQGSLDAVGVNGGYVPPPSGACCDELGACTYVQQASCFAPSVWHGEWTCSPNNCPAPPPIANDVCATAIEIPCGPFTISGTTYGAIGDYTVASSACTGYSQAAGPDVVYYIDMNAGDIFNVTMTTGGWDDAIYLVKDCGNMASCVAGDDAYPDGSTFTYTVPAGGAGRYYLIVDGYGSYSYGNFTITGTANCTPPVPVQETTWGSLKGMYR